MSTRNIRWRRWSNEKSTDFTDFIQNTSIKFVRKKNFRQTKQMPTERDHLFHSSKIHRPMSKTE